MRNTGLRQLLHRKQLRIAVEMRTWRPGGMTERVVIRVSAGVTTETEARQRRGVTAPCAATALTRRLTAKAEIPLATTGRSPAARQGTSGITRLRA